MDNDYEVGYGRPPQKYQFPKGVSGNPRGRPRGGGRKQIRTILETQLTQKITITENHCTRRVSVAEALVKRLLANALKGNRHEMKILISLIEKAKLLDKGSFTESQDKEFKIILVRPDSPSGPAEESGN